MVDTVKALIAVQQYAVILKATVLIANDLESESGKAAEKEVLQSLAAKIQTALGTKEGFDKIILTFDPNQSGEKKLWDQFVKVAKIGSTQFRVMADLTSIVSSQFA